MKDLSALDMVGYSFYVVWGLWGLAGYLFFYRGRDIAFRKRWHPRLCVFSGLLFLLFTGLFVLNGFTPAVFLLAVPSVAVIAYLSIKNTVFCSSCGKQTFNNNWFSSIEYCPKCGAKL